MTKQKLLNLLDSWGTPLLVFLLPWQARLIFREGNLAGAPSEFQTVSVAAVELLLVFVLVVRLISLRASGRAANLSQYSKLFIAFGALLVFGLFSIVISLDARASITSFIHLLEGAAMLFLVVSAPSLHHVRLAFVTSMCFEAVLGLEQIYFERISANTWLGMAAHDPMQPGTAVVETGGVRFLRAYGTLPHPNILGGALALAILCARRLFNRPTIYAMAAYMVLTAGLFFTFSRLAWIALAAGIIFLLISSWSGRKKQWASAVVAVTMIVLALCSSSLVLTRLGRTERLEVKSITTRITALRDARALFGLYPLTGVGLNAFTHAVVNEVDRAREGYSLEPVHSAPLLVATELGVFGLALYVTLFVYLVAASWRAKEFGLALTLMVLSVGEHWSWTTLPGIIIFWAAWGFAVRAQEPQASLDSGTGIS